MDGQLNLLKEALQILNLPYEKQRNILPEFVGDIMSDIVDDFLNAFYLVPQLIEKDLLTEKVLQKVVSCYVQVRINIEHSEWYEIEAFKTHKSWERVRNLARETLEEMGESLAPPENMTLDD